MCRLALKGDFKSLKTNATDSHEVLRMTTFSTYPTTLLANLDWKSIPVTGFGKGDWTKSYGARIDPSDTNSRIISLSEALAWLDKHPENISESYLRFVDKVRQLHWEKVPHDHILQKTCRCAFEPLFKRYQEAFLARYAIRNFERSLGMILPKDPYYERVRKNIGMDTVLSLLNFATQPNILHSPPNVEAIRDCVSFLNKCITAPPMELIVQLPKGMLGWEIGNGRAAFSHILLLDQERKAFWDIISAGRSIVLKDPDFGSYLAQVINENKIPDQKYLPLLIELYIATQNQWLKGKLHEFLRENKQMLFCMSSSFCNNFLSVMESSSLYVFEKDFRRFSFSDASESSVKMIASEEAIKTLGLDQFFPKPQNGSHVIKVQDHQSWHYLLFLSGAATISVKDCKRWLDLVERFQSKPLAKKMTEQMIKWIKLHEKDPEIIEDLFRLSMEYSISGIRPYLEDYLTNQLLNEASNALSLAKHLGEHGSAPHLKDMATNILRTWISEARSDPEHFSDHLKNLKKITQALFIHQESLDIGELFLSCTRVDKYDLAALKVILDESKKLKAIRIPLKLLVHMNITAKLDGYAATALLKILSTNKNLTKIELVVSSEEEQCLEVFLKHLQPVDYLSLVGEGKVNQKLPVLQLYLEKQLCNLLHIEGFRVENLHVPNLKILSLKNTKARLPVSTSLAKTIIVSP